PYIVIGRVQSTPERTKTTIGERIEVELDIWSSAKGKKETINIVNLIEDALEGELTIPGADLIDQDITSIEVLEEINDLYHGTVVFVILLDMDRVYMVKVKVIKCKDHIYVIGDENNSTPLAGQRNATINRPAEVQYATTKDSDWRENLQGIKEWTI